MKKLIISALFTAIFTLTCLSCGSTSNQTESYNNSGLVYAEKGQYDLAIADYSKAISMDPTYAIAYNNRGAAYFEKGQYDLAMRDVNKAIELNPKYAEAYHNRGYIYDNKGQYDLAIADYSKAIEWDPKYIDAYKNRSFAFYNKGQYDLAIADCNKAIELDPKYAIAYHYRSFVYISKGQYDMAIADCNKAIELDPKLDVAYYNRGIAYLSKGQYDLAKSDFEKVTRISTDNDLINVAKNKIRSIPNRNMDAIGQTSPNDDNSSTHRDDAIFFDSDMRLISSNKSVNIDFSNPNRVPVAMWVPDELKDMVPSGTTLMICAGGNGEPVVLVNNPEAKDVSYDEIMDFLRYDKTDSMPYLKGSFICSDYARTVHDNAEKKGIKTGAVPLMMVDKAGHYMSHMVNAFFAKDKNEMVLIECSEHIDMEVIYDPHTANYYKITRYRDGKPVNSIDYNDYKVIYIGVTW